ncbi:HAMP domain-containing histidine kinase [Chitinibacter bivalviorum]|uniref:histidine kinase n=1 Tax=Chitinibacter bivalviorum TaxID=2739434 RepID=A0A7H9BML3_9NEIS|nr:HAMP domain-containing sensor histidine kinase [Chitinibacter bivalviorum]QLG89626.1 HAMP domain-containing histidine kinase [Chitinibacter bivalviorum]
MPAAYGAWPWLYAGGASMIGLHASLRRRVALAFAGLTCVSLLALALAILISSQEREEQLIDEVVNRTLDGLTAQWPIKGQIYLPSTLYFYHAPMGQIPAGLPAALANYAIGDGEYVSNGKEFHVGVRELAGERFYVLYDTQVHEQRTQNAYIGVLFAVMVLSLLALGLGYFLAGTILQQLTRLTESVELGKELDTSAALDREVAILAQAIARSRHENQLLLQRERDFTSHVGHELRTPLTRIRTSAEFLRETAQLAVPELKRLSQIEGDVDEMQSRLTALLFLARDIRAVNPVRHDLPLILDAVLAGFAEQKPQVQRQVQLQGDPHIVADPQLLGMLLENLIGNALRYTEQGHIRVSWQDGVLTVSDTGAGIANEDCDRVMQPFERASAVSDGFGLGLAIVQKICDAHGWHCRLQSQIQVGTALTIDTEANHKTA